MFEWSNFLSEVMYPFLKFISVMIFITVILYSVNTYINLKKYYRDKK